MQRPSVECKTDTENLPLYKYFATVVTLITAHCEGNYPNVMACEWTMNVCREPLRIMAIIKKTDLTHELVRLSGEFGVNLCSEQQSSLSHIAGSNTGATYQKLNDPVFHNMTYQAQHIQAPMIRDCLLNAECIVEDTIDMNEYTAFIGRALTISANAELRPLLYHQGKYVRLGDWITKPTEVKA